MVETTTSTGVAETTTTTEGQNIFKEGIRMGDGSVKLLEHEKEVVEVKKEQDGDIGEERMDRQLKHYMRVNVDLIEGVLKEVIVNYDKEEKGGKEERWLRKWYKRMG